MAEAACLRAARAGGMPDGACLGVGRPGGMVEAACLEVIEGGGRMDGGRFGWVERRGMGGVAGGGKR